MKNIYWRPRSISLPAFLLVALLALSGYAAVEFFQVRVNSAYYNEQVEAAGLALKAMETVKAERLRIGPELDTRVDPARSGLLGTNMSPITSEVGSLISKRTSVNPNFAAVMILMLHEAGLKAGDAVAVGLSGSFPALDICLYAAMKTLELTPTIIASATASQWGANNPDLLWIDMERVLYERGIFTFRSVLATMGSGRDVGRGLTQQGRDLVEAAVSRNGLTLLKPDSFKDDVNQRMQCYHQSGLPIRAYVNIGGGAASTGLSATKEWLKTGLNTRTPSGAKGGVSVAHSFLRQGIPVINIRNIKILARRYGLPIDPKSIPTVGEGKIYNTYRSSPWLAGAILAAIVALTFTVFRSEWGFRVFGNVGSTKDGSPAQMV